MSGTNRTLAELRSPCSLHEIFDAIVERYPDGIAIEVPPGHSRPVRTQITYAQLRRHSNQIAAALQPNAKPDSIVVIFLPRDTPALYAAQLGVLKSGAAFTCIDPKFPDEHLLAVLEDAGATMVIADDEGRRRLKSLGGTMPTIIDPHSLSGESDTEINNLSDPRNLAYAIYTSGTTGKPKGVLIENGSIVNLVLSDVDRFQLTPRDRVAQCSSPAYDSSIEETWLAFAVGATLVLLDDQIVRLGPDLVPWLGDERITVLCPPPTLLRTTGCADPQNALPDLKLLYVGGEALPSDLADRWSAGRWMENGYGPTECTVTVLRGRIRPGETVTIGKPVRGCVATVMDESLQEMPDGEPGELCISGIQLGRGYRHRDELTQEKFPHHPKFGRLYRTGDLVRRNAAGDFEYLGRIDGQVKLRGYRVELAAIEANLSACLGVRAAGCKLQGNGAGQSLAAHIVPEFPADPPSFEILKSSLRRTLPEYMVPARFALIDHLPMTIGGKLDRNSLPDIDGAMRQTGREIVAPRTPDELAIAEAFKRALKLSGEISIHDDFFLDLGGDSLTVVGAILELHSITIAATARDLYEARTVAQMAQQCAREQIATMPIPHRDEPRERGNPILSTVVQCLWIAMELIVGSAVAYLAAFELLPRMLRDFGLVECAIALPILSVVAAIAYVPVSVGWVALIKRILIGRYSVTRAPAWGSFFTRNWIVTHSARHIPWSFLQGTILISVVLRALGAKVGRRLHVQRGVDFTRGGWDILTIGDDVTLAQDSDLRLVDLQDGELIIGPITVESGATLDVRSGMSPDSSIGRDGYLSPLSWLPSRAQIPAGSRWDGVPAAPAGEAPPRPAITRGWDFPPRVHAALMILDRCVSIFISQIPVVFFALLAPLFISEPGGRLMSWLGAPSASIGDLVIFFLLAAGWIMLRLFLQAIAMRVSRRIRPGVVGQWSLDAIRIWNKTGVAESAGLWLAGTMFWVWWLRLSGMLVGRGCEISTIIDIIPETVRIGRESFFADGIYLCSPWRHRGTITIAQTNLGRGTFLGNHAVIPAGHDWPGNLFVGVATVPDPLIAKPGTAWFGHPPMELPRREVIAADRRQTLSPGLLRYCTRLFWEFSRFFLPVVPISAGYAWYLIVSDAVSHCGIATMALVVAPMVTAACAAAMCLSIVALKWILLGRMRPGQHAFWSCWCGRWDFVFMAWENWGSGVLPAIGGTLLINFFLRLTGVRIGRRVVFDRNFVQVVDPDMLTFEDDTTVTCHFQSHTFEDRVLKLDYIRIGRGATAGNNAVIFYGSNIGEGATVSPHSVVMKRDILHPHIAYAGCPTLPMRGDPGDGRRSNV